MAWVRLHDGAMTHPKIIGLSDKAFRLWVWGLSYAQQHLTDGALPRQAITNARAASSVLVDAGLWHITETGFAIHDYMEWNDSREVITRKRSEARERMTHARHRSSRELLRGVGSTSDLKKEEIEVLEFQATTPAERQIVARELSASVPVADTTRKRAQWLLEQFSVLYSKYRNGAKYRLRSPEDWHEALTLVPLWDNARLEKLAILVLTTDDPFISGTDRGFHIFAIKASWADDKLSAWEKEHQVSA